MKQPTLQELTAFLCGEAPLDGVWFGAEHPEHRGVFWWRDYLRAAAARPAAQPVQVQVPEGWRLVPEEPPPEMLRAVWNLLPVDRKGAWDKGLKAAREIHSAWIAAAPLPPAQPVGERAATVSHGLGVPMPKNADEAAGMALLGEAWLREHAPDRLRVQPAGREALSEEQIVQQTEEVAALLMSTFCYRAAVQSGFKYREAVDPRGALCWETACQIQEMLTGSDAKNAAAEMDGITGEGV